VAKLEGWVAKLEGWVAKSEGWVAKLEGWVAKSVARQLTTAVLWVRIQTSLKNNKWAHKQRSGRHTLARQKNIQKREI
jgi:hypothetical protein